MKLWLRLVLVLMLPLLLVSAMYGVFRVRQEATARVDDERGRADGMARTIQIAVENALAARNREHSELVGLLNDLTSGQREIDWIRIIDRDGQILAASLALTPALTPSIDAVARAIDAGTGD